MSDTPNTPLTVQVPNTNPAVLPVQSTPDTPPPEPPADTPPASSVEDLPAEQLDALEARIKAARANRPPSITDAINALQEQLTSTHRAKDDAVTERKAASSQADELERSIADIKLSLRRTELAEAATVAGFAQPLIVAEHLVGKDGDPVSLVTEIAKSGAFVMKQPKPSASIGGPNSKPAPELDPGIAGLIAEINAAHGRT